MCRSTTTRTLASKGSLYLAAKIFLSLVILAHATLIQSIVTSPSYQSITGGAIKVNNLSGADKGFAKAGSAIAAAGTSCSANVTYTATPGTANNPITSGDIIYDIQLNTTGSTPASTCFTVTLSITPNGGSQTNYNVYIATGPTPGAGKTIDCKFDIGISLPSSPYTFKLSVP